jgi:hypothetical protein
MKIAAIVTVVILILLPFVVRLGVIIFKLLTKGREATYQEFYDVGKSSQLRINRKILYTIIGAYLVLMLLSWIWAIYIFIPDQNISFKVKIYTGLLALILFVGEAIIIYFIIRYEKKLNPFPKAGSDARSVLEWENRRSDIFLKNLSKYILLSIVYYLFVLIIFVPVIYYFG